MTQYAYFDSTVSDPKPIKGWYDTGALNYANLPAAANLLALTSAQWATRLTGKWAISGGDLVSYTPPVAAVPLAPQALAALNKSDKTVLRCYEHAVAVPADWVSYRAALRDIVSGTSSATTLPTVPAYPTGT